MAVSTCIKCGDHRFEVKENSPKDSPYKLIFIQCSGCGGVVGAMDYYNLGTLLQDQKETLKKISNAV